jgi:hypothetical protein
MAAIERESQEIRETTREVSQEITASYNYGYNGYDYDYGYNYDSYSGSSTQAADSSSSSETSAGEPSTVSASATQGAEVSEETGKIEAAEADSAPPPSDNKAVTS